MEKVKWILSLLMVITLIITTNLVDKASFEKISDASERIYEDRLVAQDLIFQYTLIVHQKELALELKDTNYYQLIKVQDDADLHVIKGLYQDTELTDTEEETLNLLIETYDRLCAFEIDFVASNYSNELVEKGKIDIEIIKNQLRALNEIQMIEGKKQSGVSESAMSTIELFTKMEIILIAMLAVVVLILILARARSNE